MKRSKVSCSQCALFGHRAVCGIEYEKIKARIKLLEAVRDAVEKYETYLPNSEPIGANRFVGMLVAAMNLRSAIKAARSGDFLCCGGNDETPKEHCMDCPELEE